MASTRQIEANRRNGALGGPKTGEGKQRGKYHALQHGLCAETTVLPGESERDFHKLREDLFQHWLPANEQEKFEFEQLVVAAWRLLRVRGVETEMWSQFIFALREGQGQPITPASPQEAHRSLAGVLCEVEDRRINNYFRYERAIERSYYRAVQQLQRTQRIRQTARPASLGDVIAPVEPEEQLSESGIRSVSHTPAQAVAAAASAPSTPLSDSGIRSVSSPPHAMDPAA
jgi:hypothetical protein